MNEIREIGEPILLVLSFSRLQLDSVECATSLLSSREFRCLALTRVLLVHFREEARICLILKGSAQAALGNFDLGLALLTARNAIPEQMVIIDWYWRMQLQSSLTELRLAKGDLSQARTEAKRFLEVTLASVERIWHALAWEANTRVAMAQLDTSRARECITRALSTMAGFEVPLAG